MLCAFPLHARAVIDVLPSIYLSIYLSVSVVWYGPAGAREIPASLYVDLSVSVVWYGPAGAREIPASLYVDLSMHSRCISVD